VAVLFDDAEAEVDASVQQALREPGRLPAREGVAVTEDARPVDSAEANEVYTTAAARGHRIALRRHGLRRGAGARRTCAPHDQSYAARHFRGNTFSHRDWVQIDETPRPAAQQWAAFFARTTC
jgi:amidase